MIPTPIIPVPSNIEKTMLDWLPHVLAGKDYPVIPSDEIVPELEAPAITYYFSSAGTPSQFNTQRLRTVRRPDGVLDEYWGQYHYATMNVVLRATDKKELKAMWADFVAKCLTTRRDMVIWLDLVRFLEILDSKQLDPERLKNGRDLYRAQVDLRFEYEISTQPEDTIQRVNTIVRSQKPMYGTEGDVWVSDPLTFQREIYTRELLVGIIAYIAPAE